jgi:hypothetical protein
MRMLLYPELFLNRSPPDFLGSERGTMIRLGLWMVGY